ncbi:MAG: hypothetical protein WCJ95_03755 [Mariniphaga sp.]
MFRFIETICYEHGGFQRIELHNDRCNRTRSHFFGKLPDIRLESFLSVPAHLCHETVKCTVTYGIAILNIDYTVYTIRPIKSLQLVTDNTIDYAFKYADRSKLRILLQNKLQNDEILIVKNGLMTDITYANTIYLHKKKWYSQQNPLLLGTRLQNYLNEGRVTPALLTPNDLSLFSEVRIINAMISIESSPVIPIEAVYL